jgi:hypothetical protein
MSIQTYTITNPKKIKQFREDLKRDAKQRLQLYKQQVKDFPNDAPAPCVFCDKSTTYGLVGVFFGAPVCPECAEKEAQ